MKKYKILSLLIVFVLFNFIFGYGQAFTYTAAPPSTTQANSPVPITVHGTAATGVYIGRGSNPDGASTAVGVNALVSTNAGQTNDNTAVGANAARATTTGDRNSCVGSDALFANTTGLYNCALGYRALRNSQVTSGNSAIGDNCLASLTSSAIVNDNFSYNNGFGYMNMFALTTGHGNSAFGHGGILNLVVGNDNTAMGSAALLGLAYGSNNVGIGNTAVIPGGAGAPGVGNSNDNKLSIQNVIYGVNMTGVGTTQRTGTVGIGVVPSSVGTPSIVAAASVSKLHIGSTGITEPSLQLDYVPPVTNPGTSYLYVDSKGVVGQADVRGINTCNLLGNIPRVTTAGATNTGCSQIYDNGTNVGIGVGASPLYKLDVNCNSGNIRLLNLAPYTGGPTHQLQTLIIDPTTYEVWMGSSLNDRHANTCSLDCDAIDNAIKSQQSQIEEQKIQIANQQAEITELRNKINQLVPGNVIIKDDNFQITPNPVTGTSTVSYKIDPTITNAVFIVYDLQGKMLKKYKVDKNAKEGQVQLNKKDFGNGMYILSLVSNNQEIQSKHFVIAE
ncbi:MAG: T9SS type A sorting domain-containing protein [Ferruginibacter sp.]